MKKVSTATYIAALIDASKTLSLVDQQQNLAEVNRWEANAEKNDAFAVVHAYFDKEYAEMLEDLLERDEMDAELRLGEGRFSFGRCNVSSYLEKEDEVSVTIYVYK